jgi:CRP/FNR family cyclic AMP-dependent transcriptional regulator
MCIHRGKSVSIDYKWLEATIFHQTLDDSQRNALDAALTEHQFTEGESILSQGQAGDTLYILRSGSAEVTSEATGERIHIADATEGALFGEMTVLTGEPTSASVIATGACETYRITRDNLSKLMAGNQNLVFALFAYMQVYSSRVIRQMNEENVSMRYYITGSRL